MSNDDTRQKIHELLESLERFLSSREALELAWAQIRTDAPGGLEATAADARFRPCRCPHCGDQPTRVVLLPRCECGELLEVIASAP